MLPARALGLSPSSSYVLQHSAPSWAANVDFSHPLLTHFFALPFESPTFFCLGGGGADGGAEPSRAQPSRAQPSQAKPSQAQPSRAQPSQGKPSQAMHIGPQAHWFHCHLHRGVGPPASGPFGSDVASKCYQPELSLLHVSPAQPSPAQPSQAKQGQTEPSRAEQS